MPPVYVEIERCRICANPRLEPVLHLGVQALTGVFPRSVDQHVTEGPVEVLRCVVAPGTDACGLVQLRQSYDPSSMYCDTYGYRSGLNQSMVKHLAGIAQQAIRLAAPKAGDLVIDIGSNDGTSLSCYPKDLQLIGIDPTGTKFARYYPPHVELIPDFFRAELVAKVTARKRAKIVTSIAMFYDLERPLDFVEDIRDILDDDGVWIFEQSYLPSMLEQGSYDTICHEHILYYSLRQIRWLTDRAGLRLLDVEKNDANGGSLRVVAVRSESSRRSTSRPAELLAEEERLGLLGPEPYARLRERTERHRQELTAFVRRAVADGKSVYGYGASTKGNVILQHCGFTARDIIAIAEVNEDKFGAFTPGTRIPIRSEAEVHAARPDYLLVLPWHFRAGIVAREAAYLANGGRLLFPLPHLEVVTSTGHARA